MRVAILGGCFAPSIVIAIFFGYIGAKVARGPFDAEAEVDIHPDLLESGVG